MEWGWKSKKCFVKKSFNQFCAVFEADRYIGWLGNGWEWKGLWKRQADIWTIGQNYSNGCAEESRTVEGLRINPRYWSFPQFYGTVRRNVLIPIVVYPVTYWSSQCLCQLIVPTYCTGDHLPSNQLIMSAVGSSNSYLWKSHVEAKSLDSAEVRINSPQKIRQELYGKRMGQGETFRGREW